MKKKVYSFLLLCIMAAMLCLSGCGLLAEKEPDTQMISEDVASDDEQMEDDSIDADILGQMSEFREESDSAIQSEDSHQPLEEESGAQETGSSDGSAQGYFSATDLYGNIVTQEIFTGSKLTVVNVWATYCGPCINEMPYLGELAEEYDSSKVQIVGIPTDVYNQEYLDYALSLINETGADYTHLLLSEELYNWGLTDIQYVPTTFFVNSEGEIIDTVVGSMSKEDWKTLIDEKLASL